MIPIFDYVAAAVILLLFVSGLILFHSPSTARLGDWLNIIAYTAAVAVVITRYSPLFSPEYILIAILIGGTFGAMLAIKVSMLNVPQMIAFQHGCGGAAAVLIAFSEYVMRGVDFTIIAIVGSVLGMVVGGMTFSGSLIAAGKLAKIIKQQPIFFIYHSLILYALFAIIIVLFAFCLLQFGTSIRTSLAISLIVLSSLAGIIFTIRVGGADMPVVISFFNATAGFAASFVGIALNNYLLIGCGACIAASGSLLTTSMCQAMNRSVFSVLSGTSHALGMPAQTVVKESHKTAMNEISPFDRALVTIKNAQDIIIIPGYGMALSQAQSLVHRLEQWFEERGANVRYAIHPVAGRMPGHMNVLLADAGVSYDKLYELNAINDDFKKADLSIVVGACDVVNPAATTQLNTPISGMPILEAYKAKNVLVLNWDEKPGFSGVANSLYQMDRCILLWGDAKDNLEKLLKGVEKLPTNEF